MPDVRLALQDRRICAEDALSTGLGAVPGAVTKRDWGLRGSLCSTVQRGDRVLAVHIDVELLIVMCVEGSRPVGGTSEDRISSVLRDHSSSLLGTGQDLPDAIRMATEHMDQWEAQ